MNKKVRRALLVFVVSVTVVALGAGVANAYTKNGLYIKNDVWYKTTSSFTAETRLGAKHAMQSWNAYLPEGRRVCFDTAYTSDNLYPRKNLCNAITKLSSTKSYLAENHYWYHVDDKYILESDINVNANHQWWNDPPSGYYDPQTVLLHEFGHTVGLDHSSVSNAVMYPTISAGKTNRNLRTDDINGVKSIY